MVYFGQADAMNPGRESGVPEVEPVDEIKALRVMVAARDAALAEADREVVLLKAEVAGLKEAAEAQASWRDRMLDWHEAVMSISEDARDSFLRSAEFVGMFIDDAQAQARQRAVLRALGKGNGRGRPHGADGGQAARARLLRAQGKSLRAIAAEVGISLSAVVTSLRRPTAPAAPPPEDLPVLQRKIARDQRRLARLKPPGPPPKQAK
jgi:hypothetical protein